MGPDQNEVGESLNVQDARGIHERRDTRHPREFTPEQTATCPVCTSRDCLSFFRLQSVPVTCSSVFSTRAEAVSVDRGILDLVGCNRCAFVFNHAFDASLAQIGARYESTQGASEHFRSYARSLAGDWVKRCGLTGKAVVEIGCGSGEFLVELLRAGVNSAVGIDPLVSRSYIPNELDSRVELVPAEFDEDHTRIQSDALVCRHTLEHIPDVAGFLRLVAQWSRRNPGGIVLFEVPGSGRIFSECAFWDIYYEHCNYFTRDTLAYAFARCGLEVKRLEWVYDDQYILLEAQATPSARLHARPANAAAERKAAFEFGRQAQRRIEQARENLHALAEEGPVVIWQGAAKTVGFMSALGDTQPVRCAIDLNPRRHAQYLPASGLQVLSPDEIRNLEPRHVILMNPVYLAEVESILREKGSIAQLATVNQICEGSLLQ